MWHSLSFFVYTRADDIRERQELRATQEEATKAQMFVQQAMVVSPQVQFVGQINIAQGCVGCPLPGCALIDISIAARW
jgi:hypothetical protein